MPLPLLSLLHNTPYKKALTRIRKLFVIQQMIFALLFLLCSLGYADINVENELRVANERIEVSITKEANISFSSNGLVYVIKDIRVCMDNGNVLNVAKPCSSQILRNDKSQKIIQAVFLLPRNAHLVLNLEIKRDFPALFIDCSLQNLGNDKSDPGLWKWISMCLKHDAKNYLTLENSSNRIGLMPLREGAFLNYRDWIFLNSDIKKSLGIVTRNSISYDHSTFFIWSTSRSINAVFIPSTNREEFNSIYQDIGGVDSLPRAEIIKYNKADRKAYGAAAPLWFWKAGVTDFLYSDWAGMNDWINAKYFPILMSSSQDLWTPEGHKSELLNSLLSKKIKIIPYVCFSEQSARASKSYYNTLLDLNNHIQDWACLDDKGNPTTSPWGKKTNHPHLYSMCFNAEGYQDRVLNSIKKMMDSGIDGLFIDNVGGWAAEKCNGAKLGIHKHVDPEASQTKMYNILLEKVYRLVKSYGNDKIIIHNGGLFWTTCDAQMVEDFLGAYNANALQFMTTEQIYERVNNWEDARLAGKGIVPLCYTMTLPPAKRKDANYYCYSIAKLAGAMWTNWFNPRHQSKDDGDSGMLYAMRLGMPNGDIIRKGDVLYRFYENGLVMVNAGREESKIELNPSGNKMWKDLYSGVTMINIVDVIVPPQSGRVFVMENNKFSQ